MTRQVKEIKGTMSEEHESMNHVESKIYQEKGEILQYLSEHYKPGALETYRSPGTFGHEYLIGKMEIGQLVDSLVDASKKGLKCVCCMDERVASPHETSGMVLTSHEGCGAAGIMAGQVMDAKNPQFRERFEAVVGVDTTATLIEAFSAAQTGPQATQEMLIGKAKDAFGAAWSAALTKLVEEAGVTNVSHEHIGVDAHHHYANMTVVDTARVMQVDTKGHVGERAFFVGNPEGLVQNESVDDAYDSMVMYAKLSVVIARGGHSSLPKDKPFVITVVKGSDFNQEAFDKAWKSSAVLQGEISQQGEYTLPVELKASVMFVTTDEVAAAKKR